MSRNVACAVRYAALAALIGVAGVLGGCGSIRCIGICFGPSSSEMATIRNETPVEKVSETGLGDRVVAPQEVKNDRPIVRIILKPVP